MLFARAAAAQLGSCASRGSLCNSPNDDYQWYSSVTPLNVKPSSQVFWGQNTIYKVDSTGQVVFNYDPTAGSFDCPINRSPVDSSGRCLGHVGDPHWPICFRRPAVLVEVRGWIQAPPGGPGGPPLSYADDGEQEYPMLISPDVGWQPTPEVQAANPPVIPLNTLASLIQYIPAFNVPQFGGRTVPGGTVWGGLGTALLHIEYNAWSKGRTYDAQTFPTGPNDQTHIPLAGN